MFKLIKPLAFTALVSLPWACGSNPLSGPNPEDTVLVNTSEVRPDWIEELDLSEQEEVIEELEKEGFSDLHTVPGFGHREPWGNKPGGKIALAITLSPRILIPIVSVERKTEGFQMFDPSPDCHKKRRYLWL